MYEHTRRKRRKEGVVPQNNYAMRYPELVEEIREKIMKQEELI